MFKKLIVLVAISVVTALGAVPVSAATILNGQEHNYTVQFRSDNKATVFAKLVFQNGQSEKDRDTYTFSVPSGVSVDALSVQQIIAKKTVASTCTPRVTIGTTSATQSCPVTTESYDEDFDFLSNKLGYNYHYSYYYPDSRYSENYEYTDITPSIDGETYTVKLPRAIKPHKQGALLVTFISTSYVKSAFAGRFTYDFRTLKTDEMIDEASVAINFDEELYSRDATQQRTAESSANDSLVTAGAAASYESRSMDSLLPTIGNGGEYTRSQTKMLPGDVLSVAGVYATSPSLLFLNEIVTGIAIIAALAAGLWFGMKRYRKAHPRKARTDSYNATETTRNDIVEPASIKQLLTVSGVSVLATGIALLVLTGLVATANSSNSGLIPYILSLFTIVVVGTVAIFAPIAYVLRFGAHSLLRWLLINAAIIALLCFAAIGIASIDTEPSDPYVGPSSIYE